MNLKNQKNLVIAVMVRDMETPRMLFVEHRTPYTAFYLSKIYKNGKRKQQPRIGTGT